MENCFINSNVDFTAASGWLQRFVRWLDAEPAKLPIAYRSSGRSIASINRVDVACVAKL